MLSGVSLFFLSLGFQPIFKAGPDDPVNCGSHSVHDCIRSPGFFSDGRGLQFSLQRRSLPGHCCCLRPCCNRSAQQWEVQSSHRFWEQPPTPSPRQLPQAVLMTVGQAHPRISQMPGLFPAQHSWEGSALGWGRSTDLLPGPPCPPPPASGEGKPALVHACPSAGGELGLPSLMISQLGLVKVQGGNSLSQEERETQACLPKGSSGLRQYPGEPLGIEIQGVQASFRRAGVGIQASAFQPLPGGLPGGSALAVAVGRGSSGPGREFTVQRSPDAQGLQLLLWNWHNDPGRAALDFRPHSLHL